MQSVNKNLVAKVDECLRWWLSDCVRLIEIELASKALSFAIRNHPEHPAFDRLEREGVSREEITQALKELSKGYHYEEDRKFGAVVVSPLWWGFRYDPVYLITAGEDIVTAFGGSWQYRIEKIIVEVLGEAKQCLTMGGTTDELSMRKLERRYQVYKTRFEHPYCED